MKRILTGDRPTGHLHIGHYVGSLSSRIEMQDEYDTMVMIADVQALTDNHDNPEKVRDSILKLYRDYYAVGLDLTKVKVFIQSLIPEIAELNVFFANLVSLKEVTKNPTVKTEIEDKGFGERVPFGFVGYPVSQAADILFCKADVVPVGEDQAPMLELTRKIAKRFNKVYGVDLFPEPEIKLGKVRRLPGTDGNSKMGKSLGNTINLNATTEELRQQVMGMYTDPNRVRATDPGKVEGNPVFIYHDAFNTNVGEVEDLKTRYKAGKVGDVEVKQKLFAALELFFEPIRERRSEVNKRTDQELMSELKASTQEVHEIAKETMQEVREAMKIAF
ncbi:MAG: tryptophan--tRNA ligase [Candidatus Dojkabacteria bacterium]